MNFIRINSNRRGVYWYGDAATTSNRTPDPTGVIKLMAATKETID